MSNIRCPFCASFGDTLPVEAVDWRACEKHQAHPARLTPTDEGKALGSATPVSSSGSGEGVAAPQQTMTDEQRALFMAVEDVLQRHRCSFEDLCDAYAQAFEDDAAEVEHATVKSCLEQAAVSLRSAGMDWYVSTK